MIRKKAKPASRGVAKTRRPRTYEGHVLLKQKKKYAKAKLNKGRNNDTNPQLALILKDAPHYELKRHVPYELMVKIFKEVIKSSDHPIKELCNLASVCEAWRLVILQSPSLWSRINFNQLPLTDGNLNVLKILFDKVPAIVNHVQEVSLGGPMNLKSTESMNVLGRIVASPNLEELTLNGLDHGRASMMSHLIRAISKKDGIKRLSIKNTQDLFSNQKWFVDFLVDNGRHLEELHLTSSLRAVTPQLIRALATDFCPSLRVLDLSTCDYLCNHTFDAIALSQTMPNLVILRVANVSFKRVLNPPPVLSMTKLEELSMPISMRDAYRDDALFAAFAYGSNRVTSLDLRGCTVSAYALLSMPSSDIRELHIDYIDPRERQAFERFICKHRYSLEILSLGKINCPITIKGCLHAFDGDDVPSIRELDLESSDVAGDDLHWFLSTARSLRTINLSSCRRLPRGCKGRYSRDLHSGDNQSLSWLKRQLHVTDPSSDTEIDE